MKQIKAVIKPEAFEKVKEALKKAGCSGIMVSEIEGHGKQGGIQQQWRGEKFEIDLLPKISVDVVVKDCETDRIIQAIVAGARTGGDKGEGKIFVYNVEQVVRIRTGEEGEAAV